MIVNGKVERNDLSDRVAIVTGGAGLLGIDYCHTLSAAGAHVCIADIESEAANTLAERITKSTGVSAIAHRTDVSDASSVGACVQATKADLGVSISSLIMPQSIQNSIPIMPMLIWTILKHFL